MHCVDDHNQESPSAFGSPAQFLKSMDAGLSVDVQSSDVRKLCIFAFGQSVVPAKVMSDYADEVSTFSLPVITDGRVPGWLSDDVLAVILSYGTPGALESHTYRELSGRGCRILCLVSDDVLASGCDSDGAGFIKMPVCRSLSEVYGYTLGALSRILQVLGIMSSADDLINVRQTQGCRSVPDEEVLSIAGSFCGKTQAFYSTSDIHALSLAWREIILDCGAELCFAGELPEFDHNELVGWSDPNIHAPDLQMVVLRGCSSRGLVCDIVHCMQDVLRENGRKVLSIDIGDGGSLQRNVWGMLLAFAVHDAILEVGQ